LKVELHLQSALNYFLLMKYIVGKNLILQKNKLNIHVLCMNQKDYIIKNMFDFFFPKVLMTHLRNWNDFYQCITLRHTAKIEKEWLSINDLLEIVTQDKHTSRERQRLSKFITIANAFVNKRSISRNPDQTHPIAFSKELPITLIKICIILCQENRTSLFNISRIRFNDCRKLWF
jgi:hypothetical protein